MGLVIQSINFDTSRSTKSNLIEMKSDEKSAKNNSTSSKTSTASNGNGARRQPNQSNKSSNTPLLDNIADQIESDHE